LSKSTGEVHAVNLVVAVGAVRSAGGCVSALFEGSRLTEQSIRKNTWVSWDDFLEFATRVDLQIQKLGLSDDFGRYLAPQFPVFGLLMGALIPPLQFCKMHLELAQASYRNLRLELETTEESINAELTLMDGYRASEIPFRHFVNVISWAPIAVGLPRSEVKAEVWATGLRASIHPREPENLSQRLTSELSLFSEKAAEQLYQFRQILVPQDLTPRPGAESKMALAIRRWGLTQRQARVLELLVQGKSNRDIGKALSCSDRTVEIHVTQLLKRTAAANRTELIARFWCPVDEETGRSS